MKSAIVLAATLLLTAPALADPAWSQFFDAPAADVERGTDAGGNPREIVKLDGDVQISRVKVLGTWSYVGVDFSEHGSVGCIARVFREFSRLAAQCPDLTSPPTADLIDDTMQRLAGFYAANAVPAMTPADFDERTQAYLADRPTLMCADVSQDFLALRDHMTGPDFAGSIDNLLASPRLPVSEPCF